MLQIWRYPAYTDSFDLRSSSVTLQRSEAWYKLLSKAFEQLVWLSQ